MEVNPELWSSTMYSSVPLLGRCVNVSHGESRADGCIAVGDEKESMTNFKIDVTDVTCIAVFTEHDPEIFKRDRHYVDAEKITDEL